MKERFNHKLLTILAFGMMLTFGLMVNIRGPVNPLLQQEYNITYSQLGLVMVFFSIGTSSASFFGGFLIQKFNLKQVFWGGISIGIIGLLAINYVNSYYLLIVVMGMMGIGLGALNVSGNSLASRVFLENKGRMMNIFHLFFAIGGVIAPIYTTWIFEFGFDWEAAYSFGIILFLSLFLFSLFSKFPTQTIEDKQNKSKVKELLGDSRVILFVLMFLFYVGAEVGLTGWLGVYLNDVQNRSEGEISFYISLFFILFTLGRFVASIIVEKVDYLYLVLICSMSAVVSILLALIGPNSFAFFFSLTGLFLAANFPTMQATMFEIFDEDVSAIIGITLTAGGLGNIFLANWLPGIVSDWLGINLGFGLFIIYLLVLITSVFYLRYRYIEEENAF